MEILFEIKDKDDYDYYLFKNIHDAILHIVNLHIVNNQNSNQSRYVLFDGFFTMIRYIAKNIASENIKEILSYLLNINIEEIDEAYLLYDFRLNKLYSGTDNILNHFQVYSLDNFDLSKKYIFCDHYNICEYIIKTKILEVK